MNCKEFRENLDSFVDGELSKDLMEKAQQHIDSCTKCRSLYYCEKRMKKLIQSSIHRPAAPEHLCEQIRKLLTMQEVEEIREVTIKS